MLRITELEKTKMSVTLKLEGRMTRDLREALLSACMPILESGLGLKLDMQEVLFVERQAVVVFRDLQKRGVVLSNCSLFLSKQIGFES